MNRNERQAWGPLIREARRTAGLSQDDLADQANTTRRTIGSIERGDSVAQHDVLDRVLAVLGLVPASEADPDVRAFLAMLEPLLQRIAPDERARLMPEIIALAVAALDRTPPVPPTDELAERRAVVGEPVAKAARKPRKPRLGD